MSLQVARLRYGFWILCWNAAWKTGLKGGFGFKAMIDFVFLSSTQTASSMVSSSIPLSS
jgi:hypothetical protein